MEALLHEFGEDFGEPTSLPPIRSHNHHIVLKEGMSLITPKPYHYSLVQKDVIKQQVQGILDKGIIQSSTSPFAAPIVLVKKKDSTWRLCIDYSELNKQTVRDKFSIPLIE